MEVDSDNSSSDDASSMHSSKPSGGDAEDEHLLGSHDSDQVKRSKIIVYLALTNAAIIVGAATYFIIQSQEEASFKNDVSCIARLMYRRRSLVHTLAG